MGNRSDDNNKKYSPIREWITAYDNLRDKNIPGWLKATFVTGGLAYTVYPDENLADLLKMLGYVDDIAVWNMLVEAFNYACEIYRERQDQQNAQQQVQETQLSSEMKKEIEEEIKKQIEKHMQEWKTQKVDIFDKIESLDVNVEKEAEMDHDIGLRRSLRDS